MIEPTTRLMAQPATQSMSQPATQSTSQSVTRPTSQSKTHIQHLAATASVPAGKRSDIQRDRSKQEAGINSKAGRKRAQRKGSKEYTHVRVVHGPPKPVSLSAGRLRTKASEHYTRPSRLSIKTHQRVDRPTRPKRVYRHDDMRIDDP